MVNVSRYRIEQISWISRQKFEEIWMTFLGILNLHNEDQVRPEEQASVIQVLQLTNLNFSRYRKWAVIF